jgi:hypothetical protein
MTSLNLFPNFYSGFASSGFFSSGFASFLAFFLATHSPPPFLFLWLWHLLLKGASVLPFYDSFAFSKLNQTAQDA